MVGQEQTNTGNTGTGDDNYRFWHALKPCRVPFLVLVAGVIFLLTGQGVDVMRALAEQRPGEDGPGSQIYSFSAAVLAWSISLWYWSRSMFRLKLPGVPGNVPAYRWLRTVTPRALGCIALLSVSLAFYRASNGYAPGEQQETRELLRFYSYAWAAAAAGFLAVVIMRRRWLAPLFGAKVSKAEEEAYGTSSFMQLGMPAIVTLGAAVALAATLFVGFAAFPHAWAPWFGAAAIVVFAAFGWTTVGSMVDFIGMGRRIPIFSALLLFAVLFSISNDNHEVRTLAIGQSATRENLRQSLDSWLVRQEKTKRPGERIPLFLVNAEGGGIRAAYWTASVLGEIQANNPAFADHLYSISGVSGGSLGAAVYVALLAQSREQDGLDIKQTARSILREDFLSPAVAAMLYPDLAQRLLPAPFASLDRATTLEQAWERAWNKHVSRRARMSEPFDNLWNDRQHWTPVLLLNATWVETGKRIVTSNLRIAAAKGMEDFVDTEDAHAFFAPRSVPLSTAAHMSARFTYVSPAGTLVRDGRVHGRVVDGGYFENSAATATLEIMDTIGLLKGEDPRWERVAVYVIHISNEPVDQRYPSDSLLDAPDNPRIAPKILLNEVRSPVGALYNARSARGYHSRETTMWRAGENHFFHFGLCRVGSNAPLGWVLSRKTGDEMNPAKARCGENGSIFDNPGTLQKIGLILGPQPAKRP